MNLRRINLNLMPVLRELLRTRNVTRASERLGLTQSATSAALGRLRVLLQDDLLVMAGRRMQLTEAAQRLVAPLEEALAALEHVVAAPTFDPSKLERRFVIATADYVSFLLAGAVVHRIARDAPRCSVQFIDIPASYLARMRMGEIDLLLAPDLGISRQPGVRAMPLVRDRMVCIAARGHPGIGKSLDRRTYLHLPHATFRVSDGNAASFEQTMLHRQHVQQNNVVFVPNFMLLPQIVAQTECIALVHRKLAERFTAMAAIRLLEPPLRVPDIEIAAFWTASQDRDPVHRWLRGILKDAALS
ncbi:LysR family transcriptional regulator [Reyranella sp. CPCC 100927]|uniref:LysR family transcriptional regulator n=1 Tax=Reyranella sp. CPCC 100927 TaxID=2599616 RepID=UPI0011B83121|nr:LysR family transcriptional regulator [Reyranella sp. CPCC 100927]TWT05764.1 LysR family transcriptional regulator [Reyranella sp. CPCC 100927]